MSTRILLVDDHAIVRNGLRWTIQSYGPEFSVVGEAGDGNGGLRAAEELKPDLVIMDLHLPDANGIDISRQILAALPGTKVVMLSADLNLASINEALQAGISGYLAKESAPTELFETISAAMAGRLHLCPASNALVLEHYRQVLSTSSPAMGPVLSDRERHVLRLSAQGLRTKEIALKLNLGSKTVETYRWRAMKKLGCKSTADLVRYAIREGIVEA